MHIIYIHGFNSTGPGSAKYLMLSERFGKDRVSTIDLPYVPAQAVSALEDLIEEIKKNDDNIIVVGTSLGGFYAIYLSRKFSLKCVLINPAIDPCVTTRRYLGANTNYGSGLTYQFTVNEVEGFRPYYVTLSDAPTVPTLVFLDADDEVLDYEKAVEHFTGYAHIKVYEGGNHRFAHMIDALEDIAKLYGQ